MTEEIRINRNITPSKLSDLYRNINYYKSKYSILILPNQFDKYRFGILADLLRFIITLNKNCNILKVKIDVEKNNLDQFYDQEYAYPIISLLWNTSRFVDKNDKSIKSDLRNLQNSFFTTMNSLSKMKGNKYIFVNTDHLSENRGLIRLFENSQGFNDDENLISENVKDILTNYVLTFNKNNIKEIQSVLQDIGAIIYELTKNTYEWGKTDSNLVEIPTSIRGVYMRFHKNKKQKIIEDYQNTPIANFFNHPIINEKSLNDLNQIYYLEILVFDSGVGFINKFGKNNDLSDIEIIKQCLMKNQTSSSTNLKSKKGIGLDRILRILNKKGFLRIYTDKYAIYRDLIENEYESVEKNNLSSLELNDWNKSDFNSKKNVQSQGSYVSILYPFQNYS